MLLINFYCSYFLNNIINLNQDGPEYKIQYFIIK